MISLFAALLQETDLPYQVDLHTNGEVYERIGRAQFTTSVDHETEDITRIFEYESSDRDVITRLVEVYDREGRLISSLTGQTLAGESEQVIELKKVSGRWKLTVEGKSKKDDFQPTITDPSVLWWTYVQPEDDTKVKAHRFNGGEARVDEFNVVHHGKGLVERWRPGFREKSWFNPQGRLLRQEISPDNERSVLIYHLPGH